MGRPALCGPFLFVLTSRIDAGMSPASQIYLKIKSLLAENRYEEAEVLARKAIKSVGDRLSALVGLAAVLEAKDEIVEALDHAEKAYGLTKTDSGLNALLLRLYCSARLFESAASFVDRLKLKAKKTFEEWRATGMFYQGISNVEKARHAYHQAELLAKSDFEKSTLFCNCFTLALERNSPADIEKYYAGLKALGEDDDFIFASWLNSQTQIDPHHAIEQIDSRLAASKPHQSDRTPLLLAKGNQYARMNQHELAFESWADARARLQVSRFNHVDEADQLNIRQSFYSPDLFSRLSPSGHSSNAPVFIMGMPRSGTTLLEQLLKAHPDVDGVGELSRFTNLEEGLLNQYQTASEKLETDAQAGILKAHGREILNAYTVITQKKNARIIVEKTPHNFQAVGYLALVFPHAKFLHLHRHPGDCFISSYQNRLNEWHDYVYTQETYAQAYGIQEHYRALWKQRLPSKVISVSYEALVQDTESVMRDVLSFLGLTWNEACLNPSGSSQSIRTLSRQQARSGVTSSSVARYKSYEQFLTPLFETLKTTMPQID
jgi:tetratricopeptide (TPR) repeat protein